MGSGFSMITNVSGTCTSSNGCTYQLQITGTTRYKCPVVFKNSALSLTDQWVHAYYKDSSTGYTGCNTMDYNTLGSTTCYCEKSKWYDSSSKTWKCSSNYGASPTTCTSRMLLSSLDNSIGSMTSRADMMTAGAVVVLAAVVAVVLAVVGRKPKQVDCLEEPLISADDGMTITSDV